MEPDHQRFRFSATFRTDDAAVLHCLRALNHWANRGESQPMIGWGGHHRKRLETAKWRVNPSLHE
jgi:hypothetical protein